MCAQKKRGIISWQLGPHQTRLCVSLTRSHLRRRQTVLARTPRQASSPCTRRQAPSLPRTPHAPRRLARPPAPDRGHSTPRSAEIVRPRPPPRLCLLNEASFLPAARRICPHGRRAPRPSGVPQYSTFSLSRTPTRAPARATFKEAFPLSRHAVLAAQTPCAPTARSQLVFFVPTHLPPRSLPLSSADPCSLPPAPQTSLETGRMRTRTPRQPT